MALNRQTWNAALLVDLFLEAAKYIRQPRDISSLVKTCRAFYGAFIERLYVEDMYLELALESRRASHSYDSGLYDLCLEEESAWSESLPSYALDPSSVDIKSEKFRSCEDGFSLYWAFEQKERRTAQRAIHAALKVWPAFLTVSTERRQPPLAHALQRGADDIAALLLRQAEKWGGGLSCFLGCCRPSRLVAAGPGCRQHCYHQSGRGFAHECFFDLAVDNRCLPQLELLLDWESRSPRLTLAGHETWPGLDGGFPQPSTSHTEIVLGPRKEVVSSGVEFRHLDLAYERKDLEMFRLLLRYSPRAPEYTWRLSEAILNLVVKFCTGGYRWRRLSLDDAIEKLDFLIDCGGNINHRENFGQKLCFFDRSALELAVDVCCIPPGCWYPEDKDAGRGLARHGDVVAFAEHLIRRGADYWSLHRTDHWRDAPWERSMVMVAMRAGYQGERGRSPAKVRAAMKRLLKCMLDEGEAAGHPEEIYLLEEVAWRVGWRAGRHTKEQRWLLNYLAKKKVSWGEQPSWDVTKDEEGWMWRACDCTCVRGDVCWEDVHCFWKYMDRRDVSTLRPVLLADIAEWET